MSTEVNFTPWARPRNMFEAMARYQALYGLKPAGPHRGMADRLTKDTTTQCATCRGTGLYGTYGGMGWRACPACHGFGVVYSISLDELLALRREVLEKYPDAAPRDWRPCVPIRCPILHLETGEIATAIQSAGHEPLQGELPF